MKNQSQKANDYLIEKDISIHEYLSFLLENNMITQRDNTLIKSRLNNNSLLGLALQFNVKKERVGNMERSLVAKLKHPIWINKFKNRGINEKY